MQYLILFGTLRFEVHLDFLRVQQHGVGVGVDDIIFWVSVLPKIVNSDVSVFNVIVALRDIVDCALVETVEMVESLGFGQ